MFRISTSIQFIQFTPKMLFYFLSLIHSTILPPIIPQPREIQVTSTQSLDGWPLFNNMYIGYDPSIPGINDFIDFVIEQLHAPTGFEFINISQKINQMISNDSLL